MTVLESPVHERSWAGRTWHPVLVLGLREAARILLSPVFLLVLGVLVLTGGIEAAFEGPVALPSARTVHDVITFFTALYLGLLVSLAAHLVASSARRTRAEPQLAAATLSGRQRSVGLCLGVLLGPGLVGVALLTFAGVLGNSLTATGFDGWNEDPPLSVVSLAQLGLVLVGGGLFGVMWATWLRFPGSLPLGLVVLVLGTVWLLEDERVPLGTWPWFAPYITTPQWFDESWTSVGSHSWHTVYLVGLCALAFCATMLHERERRGRWLVITGAVLAATVVAGAAQVA